MVLLLTHIAIALSSVAASSLAWLRPNTGRLRLSYGLIAGTLVSGTALVIVTHSPLLQSCLTGLIYSAAVTFEVAMAQRKLTRQSISD